MVEWVKDIGGGVLFSMIYILVLFKNSNVDTQNIYQIISLSSLNVETLCPDPVITYEILWSWIQNINYLSFQVFSA